MLGGILTGILVIVLCTVATMLLERENGEKLFDTRRLTNDQWESSILAGIIFALICIFHVKAMWLAVICYVMMIVVDIVLIKWWHKEGSDFLEMIPFVLIGVISYSTLDSVARKIVIGVDNEFLNSVLTTAPLVILIAMIGYFIVEVFVFRSKMEQ